MDNVLLPPIPPKEHDFMSQQSLSSLRSVTVTTSNKSNGGAGGCTDNNNSSQLSKPNSSQLSNVNSQQNSQLSNPNNSQLSGPKLELLESQPTQQSNLKMPTSNNNTSNNNSQSNLLKMPSNNVNTSRQPPDNNNEEEEEEEANTQETYTQQMLTQGQELTQLGFDDDNLDMNDTQSQDGIHSPTPIDPLTLPWGRLMPVGLNDEEGMPPAGGGRDYNNNGGRDYNRPNSSRGAKEMLPRSPIRSGSSVTRSRSPSPGRKSGERDDSFSQSPTPNVNFLGLKNLLPSDRFNEYILGRSVKADVSAQKLDVPPPIQSESSTNNNIEELEQRANAKRKRHDYVHAMISNRHCKVYCLLSGTIGNNNKSNNKSSSSPSPPEMEVFVEDTSGNGTLINGTTLLRRNERRKLHTGDVICLLNPKLLSKKLRSVAERKMYMSQYSYVFVNLYEQEARHGWGVNSMLSNSMSRSSFSGGGGRMSNLSGSSPGRSTAKKKGAVNPRATKCHSIHTKGKRSLFSSAAGGGKKVPIHQLSSSRKNNGGGRSSLGSFLNKSNLPSSNNNNTISTSSQRRRVEEEYDLRDLLGTGTCGEVRRAIHRRTGEERAIKIISIGGRNAQMPGMSTEKLSSIQAEAQILRSLDHPYIVKLFDMYISPGKAIYLVMELIRGGDLFDRIVEKERYTEVQARRLFRRILTAVYYLHEERGIVHRDLKPENILVVDRRNDVNIKLTDFGLAKNMTAEGLKTFCGTPQYFAPEVLRRRHTVKGDGRYGKEIDCWSIGVILFILLSGSPPFDVSAGFDAVANAKVAFYDDQWKHVSSEARDLVMRLLEKDPRKRMSVRDACRHAWVLVNDGDTHCHPLHDPVVANVSGSDAMTDVASKDIAEAQNNNEQKNNTTSQQDEKPASSDAPSKPQSNPPSQERQICAPVDANALSPKPNAVEQNTKKPANQRFQSMSAPQLSKDERKPSIWPVNQNDKVATKVIQQACEDSQPSPNGSPIKKKQLFNESAAAAAAAKASNNNDNVTDTTKKMTKQGVESIKAAGNTLPTPVINKESHLIKKVAAPKKKVQSTLFPTANNNTSKQQAKATSTNPPAAQPQVGQDNQTKKRKAIDLKAVGTPSVTPPGTESNTNNVGLVFQLNKKIKVGGKKKNVSPGQQAESSTAAAPEKKKAELSEDELESDFSDDEGESLSKSPMTDKKPLEKYLQKRKMESIESSASAAAIGKKKPQSTQEECGSYQGQTKSSQESSQESRRVSKSPQNPLKSEEGEIPNNNNSTTTTTKGKERKMKQSYLFGKPPPPNNELPNGTEASNDIPAAADEDEDTKAVESQKMQIDREVELERQPTTESNGSGNSSTSAPKGKQRSIKSWFAPKN